MENSLKRIKSILIVSLILSGFAVSAQLSIRSPYSKFGLGLQSDANNPFYQSMGGLSYSLTDPLYINSNNPASYINTPQKRFIFNASFNGYYTKLENNTSNYEASYSNIETFKFAFPITNWLKSSFGLKPFTQTGYNIINTEEINSTTTDTIGTATYNYKGNGGINQFYFGNAIKVYDNLSLGFNMSYLFGNINHTQSSSLNEDYPFAYNYRLSNTFMVKSFYMDYGLQYQFNFENDYRLQLGLVYSHNQNINFKSQNQGITYTLGNNDFEYKKDTLINETEEGLSYTYPGFIGGGFSFKKKDKWLIGADFKTQAWSQFKNPLFEENFKNSMHFKFGGYYQMNRTKVKFGLRYDQSKLNIYDTDINNLGISFGVNVPLRIRQKPFTYGSLDLGFEYVRSGTKDAELIQQDYFRFFMGIAIANEWFRKPKYQ